MRTSHYVLLHYKPTSSQLLVLHSLALLGMQEHTLADVTALAWSQSNTKHGQGHCCHSAPNLSVYEASLICQHIQS